MKSVVARGVAYFACEVSSMVLGYIVGGAKCWWYEVSICIRRNVYKKRVHGDECGLMLLSYLALLLVNGIVQGILL